MSEELNPQQVLHNLSVLYSQGKISKDQVDQALQTGITQPSDASSFHKRVNLQQVLYYIGGFIVLCSIVIFIAQFWQDFLQPTKVAITLGPAAAAYSLGYYFLRSTKHKDIAYVAFLIAAALFPLGIGTAMTMLGIQNTSLIGVNVNIAILFIIYFITYYSLRVEFFLPISIFTLTALYFTFSALLFDNISVSSRFRSYQALTVAVAYLFVGYYYAKRMKEYMATLLYFFGALGFLAVTFSLQLGQDNLDKVFWEIAFPPILFVFYYLSVKLQSKSILAFATIFTFVEIVYLSTKYFSHTVGWPVTLIVAGLLIMASGYISFNVNKRFFSKRLKPEPAPISQIETPPSAPLS